jgi:hypothetical protein
MTEMSGKYNMDDDDFDTGEPSPEAPLPEAPSPQAPWPESPSPEAPSPVRPPIFPPSFPEAEVPPSPIITTYLTEAVDFFGQSAAAVEALVNLGHTKDTDNVAGPPPENNQIDRITVDQKQFSDEINKKKSSFIKILVTEKSLLLLKRNGVIYLLSALQKKKKLSVSIKTLMLFVLAYQETGK